jgi:hypothetical protein
MTLGHGMHMEAMLPLQPVICTYNVIQCHVIKAFGMIQSFVVSILDQDNLRSGV